jgi:hypothetical protein
MNRTPWVLGATLAGIGMAFAIPALAAESRTLIMGLYPNELGLVDEATEKLVGTIPLRHGIVTGYGMTPHTPDFRRLYYITDRMEAVEVVDPEAGRVVDELRLSTANRRVRFLGVYPRPGGNELILRVVETGTGVDRFEAEDTEYLEYDLSAHEEKGGFHLPKEVRVDFTDPFPFASDGRTFFAFGRDVFEISASTHEVVSRIPLASPRAAGYGPLRHAELQTPGNGIYYGLVTTVDPVMKKEMMGVLRVDLGERAATSFEIGPELAARVFALSPDGKIGYAGVTDLARIDMESHRVVALKKDFLQGRAASVLIVSTDGTRLFVTGIGDAIQVVDAETLEVKRTIQLGRDLMADPLPLPSTLHPHAMSVSK